MPARKSQSLHTRHATRAEKVARIAEEESMAPERGLPMAAPARLKGHPLASEAWRRLMRYYAELEAQLVTRLDQDLLIDYCLLMEQTAEIDLMRRTTYAMWLDLGQAHAKTKDELREARESLRKARKAAAVADAEIPEDGPGSLKAVQALEEKAVELSLAAVNAFEAVVKLDGRVDRKRALLLQWRQALYLTPRARAGVAPAKKEEPEPESELDALLNDVTAFVQGGGKQ